MVFKKSVTIAGDATYEISPNIKKYTLGDLGFVKNNANAYVLRRSLEPSKALGMGISLKVTINENLDGFKLSTVSARDVMTVDIFKNQNSKELVEIYRYYMDEFVDRQIFIRK